MQRIDEAHRNQNEPRSRVEGARVTVVEVRELDLGLSLLVRGHDRVGVLELGVQQKVVIELVAEVDDGAQKRDLIVPPRRGSALILPREILVERLPVAAE